MARIFTEEEKGLIDKLYHEGYPLKDIRNKLRCRGSTLTDYLRENGYPVRLQNTLINYGGLKNSRRHHFNEHYFDEIDTPDKAYWLGFWYADGNVTIKKNKKTGRTKGGVAEITLKSEDKNHLLKMLKCLDADDDYPIQDRTIHLNGKEYYACRVMLHSIDLCNSLIKQGCVPAKSLILQPPNLNEDFISHFIRGYFDGDGCVSFNDETKIGNVSLLGTKEVLDYVIEHTDISKTTLIHDKRGNKAFALFIGSCTNTIIFYNYIYSNADMYLDRKKVKYDKYIKYLKETKPELYKRTFSDDALIKHQTKGKVIVCISSDFANIKIYNSIKEAERKLNINSTCVSNCINHKAKSSGGYYWLSYIEYLKHKSELEEYMDVNYLHGKRIKNNKVV